jgi:hypothetical protein
MNKKLKIFLFLFLNLCIIVQAALVIRGFGIRGFDYSRFLFCTQNLVFAVFFLVYSRIFSKTGISEAFLIEKYFN